MPEIGQILRNTIKTTGTLEDRQPAAADALHRRHRVLRHRPRLPATERRQHHPARPGQPAPGCRCWPATRRSTPACSAARARRQARGRGVPRLHPAHRARDAAQPAARLHRRRQARCTATTAGRTASTCPTRRGTSPTRCATSPTSTTASTARPARAPTASHRRTARAHAAAPGTPAAPAETRLLKSLLGPSLGESPAGRARPRRAAGRADGPRREGVAAMKPPRHQDPLGTWSSW